MVEAAKQIEIQEGRVDDILALYPTIPELKNAHGRAEYEKRLYGATKHLLLVAYEGDKPVGFKAGYERDADGSFYSWMGGVAVTHRRYGIAGQLAEVMERWAKEQGYLAIRFKTRNSHKPMLLFALKNGFDILAVEPREEVAEHRIVLEKKL
jgi:GNAT superfamily N-acetyltransferase